MEIRTSRLRFFAPDSHVLTNHATSSSHEERDTGFYTSTNLRRLRATLLKVLNHDELMLDLAFHRVMNISNRKSAEQFGIDPSVANRKGRRAVLVIKAAVLGMILVERIMKNRSAILFPKVPQRTYQIGDAGFFVPIPRLSKTFKKVPTEKQTVTFIRRHGEVLGLDSESSSESANIALASWNTDKEICVRIGYVCSCLQTANESAAITGAESIFDLSQEVPTNLSNLADQD